jgi:hypothetical protein
MALPTYVPTYLPTYGSTALVDLGPFFSFLIYMQSVGLLGRGISPSQGRYLNRGQTHTDNNASNGIRTDDPSVRAVIGWHLLIGKVKVVPVLNQLSNKPRRCMGDLQVCCQLHDSAALPAGKIY